MNKEEVFAHTIVGRGRDQALHGSQPSSDVCGTERQSCLMPDLEMVCLSGCVCLCLCVRLSVFLCESVCVFPPACACFGQNDKDATDPNDHALVQNFGLCVLIPRSWGLLCLLQRLPQALKHRKRYSDVDRGTFTQGRASRSCGSSSLSSVFEPMGTMAYRFRLGCDVK